MRTQQTRYLNNCEVATALAELMSYTCSLWPFFLALALSAQLLLVRRTSNLTRSSRGLHGAFILGSCIRKGEVQIVNDQGTVGRKLGREWGLVERIKGKDRESHGMMKASKRETLCGGRSDGEMWGGSGLVV